MVDGKSVLIVGNGLLKSLTIFRNLPRAFIIETRTEGSDVTLLKSKLTSLKSTIFTSQSPTPKDSMDTSMLLQTDLPSGINLFFRSSTNSNS